MAVATTTVLTTAAIVIAVAGAATGAYSAIQSAKAQEKAADFNEKVAQNNATLSKYQAAEEARRLRVRNMRIAGAQRVAGAKSGIELTSGSFQDVMRDTAIQGEMDALTALYTGKVDATRSLSQAKLFGMEGKQAMRQGYLNAGASLLSGASSATSAGYSYASRPQFN